nr:MULTISPECIES: DNA/RNA non-specific endonuclease [unclassified Tychonema]
MVDEIQPHKLYNSGFNVSLNNLAGFKPDDGAGASHRAALAWYAGTANLNESQFPSENGETIYRRLGDLAENNIADGTKTWYTPDHTNASFTQGDTKAPWEGIGTGWFHSVLGGGSEFRPYDLDGYKFSLDEIQEFGYPNGWKNYLEGKRVSVTEDNTPIPAMRGDFAVPTLFNGNFDAIAAKLDSQPLPGWSLYNGDDKSVLQRSLVNAIGSNSGSTNYALALKSDESITHNPFVVPDWGNLRFDVHAPVASGKLRVTLETIDGNFKETNEIDLGKGLQIPNSMTDVSQVTSAYLNNLNAVGFGRNGFETFQMNLPTNNDVTKQYRGQPATLKFELEGGESVYLDNVFFKSDSLNFGNPTEARWNIDEPAQNPYQTNLLLEKPQYTSSYNAVTGLPNWVSWQVDNTWSQRFVGRTGDQFIVDPDLPNNPNFPTWSRIDGTMYQGSGLDKGHLVPDKDRNRNQKDALATYMSTNLIPQAIDNNRLFRNNPDISPAWSRIESKLVEQLIFDYNKKLDITAGVFDTKPQNWSIQPKTRAPEALTEAQNQGNTNPTNLEANGIRIPGWTWKTILVSNKSNLGVQDILGSYTYITPNIPEPYTDWNGQPAVPNPLNQLLGENREPITSAEQWRTPSTWKISINQLENLLNAQGSDKVFNFLSNLPEDVRNRIKQQSDFQFPPP